ncbi:hypothetical protein CDIK_0901 [Cucumispora dikerogammari]|nr:hypothetical protein CDIK_0901 [Cucumispora dikerogammari]
MYPLISPALRFKLQMIYYKSSFNPCNDCVSRVYTNLTEKINKSTVFDEHCPGLCLKHTRNIIRKYCFSIMSKKLNNNFRNADKLKNYYFIKTQKEENFAKGKSVVNKMLISRGSEKDVTKKYINCSINNPFCVENVAPSLFPLGKKVDFFLKQRILKSLFLHEDDL